MITALSIVKKFLLPVPNEGFVLILCPAFFKFTINLWRLYSFTRIEWTCQKSSRRLILRKTAAAPKPAGEKP